MNVGEFLTHGTIRTALLCYVAVLALQLRGRRGERWRHVLRPLWTAGCVAFVAHVVAAFHFYHHWSHQHAIAETAKQTRELVGWAFGEGLYFSYLFLVLWIGDAAWWWIAPRRYETRPKWLSVAFHGYLYFIAFNGAVVFENGVTRIGGILATVVLAAIAARAIKPSPCLATDGAS